MLRDHQCPRAIVLSTVPSSSFGGESELGFRLRTGGIMIFPAGSYQGSGTASLPSRRCTVASGDTYCQNTNPKQCHTSTPKLQEKEKKNTPRRCFMTPREAAASMYNEHVRRCANNPSHNSPRPPFLSRGTFEQSRIGSVRRLVKPP